MFSGRGRTLPELCTDLAGAVIRLDERGSTKSFREVVDRAGQADAAELTGGLTQLIPALREVSLGNGAMLAGLVAGLVETGADPVPVLDVLVERVARGLEQAALFPVLADKLGADLVAPNSAAEARAVHDLVVRAAPAAGLGAEEAGEIAQAWFTVNSWIPALLLPLQQKRARRALPQRARLTGAVSAMTDAAEDAPWLLGLLLVLDDEELVVVHRATGRAYAVTISGVGDNFQLHTLLAATLIGDPADGFIAGEPPHPAWVAAATDGELAPPGGVHGRFNLVDFAGNWIWNEGRPADIPALDGRRVVVLDPPPYPRSWNVGRVYPLMSPQITVDRLLEADEAGWWTSRLAPPSRQP
jgi:hypothetical protein